MIKDHVDYKLINISLLVLIVFLIVKTSNFWSGVVDIVMQICFPFFVAFILSYAVYPIKRFFNRFLPNFISVILVFIIIIGIISLFLFTVLPLLITQTGPVLENIIYFLGEMSFKYNINFESVVTFINNMYDSFLHKTGNYLAHGMWDVIGVSINVITIIFVIIAVFGYLLNDMDKIRNKIKQFLSKKNLKLYAYFDGLDNEMNNYLTGFLQIIIITFFEYLLVYFIIGHPNYLVLAIIAAISNLIPYFGGVIANLMAFITAFAVSPTLLIKTCIVWVICGIIDGYIINPLVYGKKSNLHPLLVIASMFIGGLLGGFLGIILSLPLAILILYTFKFLKKNHLGFIRKG